MRPLTVTIRPGSNLIRLLATSNGDDCLRAVLPRRPNHPRALTALLEALAAWIGTPAHAAIYVGRSAPGSCEESLWGGGLLPEDTALVRFYIIPPGRPKRLTGLGDFRDLYAIHGRTS